MEMRVPSGVVVILGTFESGIKFDVMEGKPILYGRRSWKWLLDANIEMWDVGVGRERVGLWGLG